MLFFVLWVYHIATKMATRFSSFHLVDGVEAIIPIECQIPTLHTILGLLLNTTPLEQCLLHLDHLNEEWHASLQNNISHKVHTKDHYDQQV